MSIMLIQYSAKTFFVCLLTAMVAAPLALANTTAWAKVERVGCSRSSGTCWVVLENKSTSHANPATCSSDSQIRWRFNDTEPLGHAFLSMLLSAQASNREVELYLYDTECLSNQPSIAFMNLR